MKKVSTITEWKDLWNTMENPRGDPRLFKILNYDEIVHAGQQGDT
jgi:hypothetical protein